MLQTSLTLFSRVEIKFLETGEYSSHVTKVNLLREYTTQWKMDADHASQIQTDATRLCVRQSCMTVLDAEWKSTMCLPCLECEHISKLIKRTKRKNARKKNDSGVQNSGSSSVAAPTSKSGSYNSCSKELEPTDGFVAATTCASCPPRNERTVADERVLSENPSTKKDGSVENLHEFALLNLKHDNSVCDSP